MSDPLRRAVAALDPDLRRVGLAVLAGVSALGCTIGLMATSAWLISRAAQQPPVVVLSVAVVATRAFGIGRGVLRYAERLVSHDVALRGVVTLRERLYVCLAGADPAVVSGLRRGDLLARVGADVDALADVVVRSLLPFAVGLVTSVVTVLLLGLVLPAAGLATAVGLAMAGVAAPWLAAVAARRAEQDAAAARAATSAEVLALLDGLAELTVAGAAPGRLRRLGDLDDGLSTRLDVAARPAAVAAALATLGTGGATVACLLLGAQAVASGRLSPVMLAVVTLTPMAAAEAVLALPAAATGLVRARVAAERVLELLDVPAASGPIWADDARPAPLVDPLLEAVGLACGWPGHPPVLTDVDLTVSPGRTLALVGPSGAGKTTLLLTLAGLLPPAGGTMTLRARGATADQHAPAVVRRTVGFTAEDAHVFTTTVAENVRVADPDADDQAVTGALERAGLGPWLQALPSGLGTMLGSGGTGLSGGERRRLLLARALVAGTPLVLLDEPGEHLDPETADVLLGDLLTAGPGVVLATHRVSALAAADEVLVVGDGTVVARGSHAWLLAHHEGYADAWHAERGGADEAPGT